MNAGHLYYTLGNIETAINYYQKAQSMCEDRNMFLTFYLEDKNTLLKKDFRKKISIFYWMNYFNDLGIFSKCL